MFQIGLSGLALRNQTRELYDESHVDLGAGLQKQIKGSRANR